MRQLHLYRREKLDLEKRVEETAKRYRGSRQHIQVQDAALEEVKSLIQRMLFNSS